ncbi:hypothetical protein DEO72_LG7g1235 [Vigna unguiculata]|uniref:Uncharacterized protein n=1 Tax=Vigna unguiculata TaxID=3917 RepID=A0A4D6MIA3_VIGUN|nr:hypothetical protein DEO72_LG7g1235 [Vigna unguiculata]
MFAWWWRDAGTLAERQREGRLVGTAWPDATRDSDRGLAWWSRVVVDGRETRRRQGARVVVSRGGGWTRDETAVAGCETRRRWQEARVVVSSGGLAGSHGEKKKQRRRQRNSDSGSDSTRGGGSGSTELALLEWPELAESRRNLQREMAAAHARKNGVLFLSPN